MRQHIIRTRKCTLLIAELSEKIEIQKEEAFLLQEKYGNNIEILGVYPSLFEEDAGKVVESSALTGLAAHYVEGVNPPNVFRYKSKLESLDSLLHSADIYFENPYGEKYTVDNITLPEYKQEQTFNQYHQACLKAFDEHHARWQEAQNKVWDKKRTYLFILKEDALSPTLEADSSKENTWIKIESEEDLPKETGLYWTLRHRSTVPLCRTIDTALTDLEKEYWMVKYSHYMHIQRPELPKEEQS